jgi:dTDP-4-amino-4,6-dideoxygalactose transaminase
MNDTCRVIPFLDLSVPDDAFRRDLLAAVDKVLRHGRIILGPEVRELEEKISGYCRTRHAVGVGSGSDALLLALKAYGIGQDDEVVTTPLSWIATTNAIVLNGASPKYADIREDLNIDPQKIEDAITERTKAIVPVHFSGQMCDMMAIKKIAQKHGLVVIEDAAQAFGSQLDNKPAGSFGNAGCFSLNPMKVLNAWGEAGMVTTDSDEVNERLVSLRYAGTVNKEDCHVPSINGRLDTIQAAMLLVNLHRLPKKLSRRQKIAARYTAELDRLVSTPVAVTNVFHSYYSYTIMTDARDELKIYLESRGIETKIQHPILMPFHSAYMESGTYPVAEAIVKRVLCLPNHEDLSEQDQDYVISVIREFFDGK